MKSVIQNHSNNPDAFYTNFFGAVPYWSTPYPNSDEAPRWARICTFLSRILHAANTTGSIPKLRILDVGCGRGWLTYQCGIYGSCDGVEPVAEVVTRARAMYPQLRFYTGTAKTVREQPDFAPYDVVVTSEVIEHVPGEAKPEFVKEISDVLKPGGYVILTTPRGELFRKWKRIVAPGDIQPVEQWLTAAQVRRLFSEAGFVCVGYDRAPVDNMWLSKTEKALSRRWIKRLMINNVIFAPFFYFFRYFFGFYQVFVFQKLEPGQDKGSIQYI